MAAPNSFSPDVADKLLDKLSSDDDFRQLFQTNPREALRQCGHETPDNLRDIKHQDPVLCLYSLPVGLASKDEIRTSRDKMRSFLTSTIPVGAFGICARQQ